MYAKNLQFTLLRSEVSFSENTINRTHARWHIQLNMTHFFMRTEEFIQSDFISLFLPLGGRKEPCFDNLHKEQMRKMETPAFGVVS